MGVQFKFIQTSQIIGKVALDMIKIWEIETQGIPKDFSLKFPDGKFT